MSEQLTTVALPIVIQVTTAYSTWNAFTPPHRPAESERLQPSLVGRFAIGLVSFMKISQTAHSVVETALILAKNFPSSPYSQPIQNLLCASAGSSVTGYTLQYVAGTLLTLSGGLIRQLCYATLGKFFTFEMAIRKGHRLVTTGPYGVVRHPGYLGLILAMSGEFLLQSTSNAYISRCLLPKASTAGRLGVKGYFGFLGLSMLFVAYGTIQRGIREDKVLKEKFGDEWVEWSKRTPYRMIPYIY